VRAGIGWYRGELDHDTTDADGRWYRRRIPQTKTVTIPGSGPLAVMSDWSMLLRSVG
jgi:hypothetical protein